MFPHRNKEEEGAVGAIYCKKIDDLLQQSDFVLLSVNLTPQTHKLIGKRELELMKPTATLINISRGRVQSKQSWRGKSWECPAPGWSPAPWSAGCILLGVSTAAAP